MMQMHSTNKNKSISHESIAKKSMNLSFSGCGFLCVYHAGVAAAIREYAPELTLNQVSGASAGAIAAAGLICGVCLGAATSDILRVVTQARKLTLGPLNPWFNLIHLVREGLYKTLPDNAHELCTGRLRVSLTRFDDGENVIVSDFDTKEELIQAIICSCFIPFYCGNVAPTFRGKHYFDGGWSDNQPSIDEETVTVSPFCGETDICPPDSDSASMFGFDFSGSSIRFTARNLYRLSVALFPPHPEVCSRMVRQGFEDTLRFLAKNGLVSCSRCLAVRSSIALPIEIAQQQRRSLSSSSRNTVGTQISTSSGAHHQRHHRGQSECESCQETAESINSNHGRFMRPLPVTVQRTLDDAEASERSLIAYMLNYRLVRWMRTLMLPWLLPIEFTYLTCRSVMRWIQTVKSPQWLIDRSTLIVDFIMQELYNQQKHFCTTHFGDRFANATSSSLSYWTGITSTSDSLSGQHPLPLPPPPQLHRITRPTTPHPDLDSIMPIASSTTTIDPLMIHSQHQLSETIGQTSITDLDLICVRDNSQTSPVIVSGAVGEDNAMNTGGGELDAVSHVVEYSKRHDSLLAYYYLDDDNKVMNRFEIIDMQQIGGGVGDGGIRQNDDVLSTLWQTSARKSSTVPINEFDDEDTGRVPTVDSGLSLAEDIMPTPPPHQSSTTIFVHHRDACCSPVHELDNISSQSTGASSSHQQRKSSTTTTRSLSVRSAPSTGCGGLRSIPSTVSVRSLPAPALPPPQSSQPLERSSSVRATSTTNLRPKRAPHQHYKHHRLSGPPMAASRVVQSSDSDADGGEKFFVPDRRNRKTSSDEYDGEPEASDTT